MSDTEFIPINDRTVNQIPLGAQEPFRSTDLPHGQRIIDEVFINNTSGHLGEVAKAKQDDSYIGLSDEELGTKVPALIADCLNEMEGYEVISRKRIAERLSELRAAAPNITRVIDFSGPGDYYHLNKNDRFKDVPATFGIDRLRSDQAATLAIVLAGIRAGWPDEELLSFLQEPILMNDNPTLDHLREKAGKALRDSGIRIVYSGREDEIRMIKMVLNQKNIFIPKECVDFVGPEGIDNTIDQTNAMKEYLEENLQEGQGFIQPINMQGIRSMRIANKHNMIPENTNAYIWAMPTVTGPAAEEYRVREVKGAVYYSLIQQASFEPADYTLI